MIIIQLNVAFAVMYELGISNVEFIYNDRYIIQKLIWT